MDESGFAIGEKEAGRCIINAQVHQKFQAKPGCQEWVLVVVRRNQIRRKEGSIMPQITTSIILRPHARIQIVTVLDVAYLPYS